MEVLCIWILLANIRGLQIRRTNDFRQKHERSAHGLRRSARIGHPHGLNISFSRLCAGNRLSVLNPHICKAA